MNNENTKRTKWQIVAAQKYPRLYFLGGDGQEYECWVAMTKCVHPQTRCWRYRLAATQAEAEKIIAGWNATGCSYECHPGDHSLWRLRA